MKVLLVASCSYPMSGTGTNIINKLLFDGKLVNNFDKTTILCGKENPNELDFENIDGIQVFRTFSYTVYPKELLKDLKKKNIMQYLQAVTEKVLFHIEERLFHNAFGDRFAVRAFYKKLKKIWADSFDLIISMSGRYYTSIATARFCKRKGIPFIFYQVDPCASNQYLSVKSLQRRIRIEKEIYQVADYVFTTDLIHKDVINYLPEQLCKKVIELEFPLISKPKVVRDGQKRGKKAVCVFSGSIYGGIRDPQYTLDLFRKLNDEGLVELHFSGVSSGDVDNAEFVCCHGALPLNQAMQLIADADFLINIGNSVTNQVPSKLFDYISMGKPIINICKNHTCPTIKYLDKYPCSINLFEDEDCFETQLNLLRDFILNHKEKEESFLSIKKLYFECTPEYCADIFMRVISSLELK